ncbi:predicted protein [Plenodomus lingam JN3]|uniref:Predicted protein n=1 Tax=Leptosphaeria maculans (strain JN3 / isolate v23.1.3 / race Av1-4-5-6-7-8) TaxID=985895 RepID=E5AB47_LEPMJ|nr:predicted protein [Plenodomus lingam JN3]CBY00888.1 predicted protein [Plenodomus lingam JN3]
MEQMVGQNQLLLDHQPSIVQMQPSATNRTMTVSAHGILALALDMICKTSKSEG